MKYVLHLSFLILLFASCSNQQTDHDHADLRLDNGKKWAVNEEMKPHITAAEGILNDYLWNEGTDHQALAKRLESQNKKLITSCTMKGESHDELHKWLHPHMALISKLEKAETPEAASSIVQQLVASFKTYNSYFE